MAGQGPRAVPDRVHRRRGGGRRARLLAPRQRLGPAAALRRVRRAIGQTQRRPHDLDPGQGAGAVGPVRRRGVASSSWPAPAIGNAQIGDSYALASITAAVLGGAALAGGRATFIGAAVASVLLALILTALPFLGLSAEHGLMIIGVLVLLGIVLFQVGDIKELVKRNYKRARRLAIGSRVAERRRTSPTSTPSGPDFRVVPTGRTLIRGGTVLSLDPDVGDFSAADVLIEHGEIVAVGPGLQNGEAEVIDASGMIVMPGFVDSPPAYLGGPPAQHRHRRAAGGAVRATSRSCCTSWRRRSGPRTRTSATCSRRWERSTPGSRRCSTGRTSRAHRRTPTR